MSEYIRRDTLSQFQADRPLPISQMFIDVLNERASAKAEIPRDEVLAEATLVALAALEDKLGKLMEAVGVREAD